METITIVQNPMPFNATFVKGSNADGNGNYQTYTYYIGGTDITGTKVGVIALTYDASSNVITAQYLNN